MFSLLDLLTPYLIFLLIQHSNRWGTSQKIGVFHFRYISSQQNWLQFFFFSQLKVCFHVNKKQNCRRRADHLVLHPDSDGDQPQLFHGRFVPNPFL